MSASAAPLTLEEVFLRGNNADEILQGVWLGNMRAALDENFLRKNNITTVFNCSKETDIPFHPSIQRRYRIPVDDNLKEEEIRHLEFVSFEAVAKIALEIKQGHKILIHCAAGMQRSAAVTAMLLIAIKNITVEQAIHYIRSRRPIAFGNNANFLKAILGFYNTYQEMMRVGSGAGKLNTASV